RYGKDGRPVVFVDKPTLMYFLHLDLSLLEPDRRFKNTILLALVHEMVHLERGKEIVNSEDRNLVLEEEKRTWQRVTAEGIVPLLAKQEPLIEDLVLAGRAYAGCQYPNPCPKLDQFVEQLYQK
ncbi:MAG: hypothetical protein KW802_03370, partial [Candidatus Doudnabacteria bacterium]|nr:hypothetical protein [Candidatus Doudnabacteria bacterium]